MFQEILLSHFFHFPIFITWYIQYLNWFWFLLILDDFFIYFICYWCLVVVFVCSIVLTCCFQCLDIFIFWRLVTEIFAWYCCRLSICYYCMLTEQKHCSRWSGYGRFIFTFALLTYLMSFRLCMLVLECIIVIGPSSEELNNLNLRKLLSIVTYLFYSVFRICYVVRNENVTYAQVG